MAKLTTDQKKQLYNERKNGESFPNLSKKYGIRQNNVKYLVRLIDYHGFDILRKNKNRKYSKELKLEIINKVLVAKQSIVSTSIEYGLSSDGILYNWIKSYKENECDIVEKKRGRPSAMKSNNSSKKYEEMTDKEKIEYLQNKNLYLEAENEYLKKLRAVVQQRKNRQQKKK